LNDIMSSLQAPRPNRSSRRAQQLGIDQGPNKLAPAQGPMQQGQVQVNFAHSLTHLVIVIQNNLGQTVIPMTAEQWEQFKLAGDAELAAIPAAEPEPAPVYDDDEAVLIRIRIEECAVAYGRFVLIPDQAVRAFRHPMHMTNWAAKHELDMEPDPATGGVVFYPAAQPMLTRDELVDQPPEMLSAETVHVGAEPT
jgi:hypothetical protein